MKKILLSVCLVVSAVFGVAAQVSLVRNGKASGRIVADTTNMADRDAAVLLQDFIQRISDAKLPVVAPGKLKKGDVVIDRSYTDGLTEDGFSLVTDGGKLYIGSGGDKGAVYGVVTLLEDYLGVNYYASNICTFERRSTIELPYLCRKENPAFRYRQSQNYGLHEDPVYRMWMRLEEPSDEFADGLWVHTFNRLLPSAVYGKSHPEYYSFINGERRPGNASQWCLTNPAVLDAASARIDSIFKANPGKNMISVSQNDGNYTNCSCPDCKAVDEYEGALSGNFIRFVNKLAERMPDKQFSTLAYLFTMHPPKHVKPLPNVNIMLCDIDCKREVPLTDNASGRDFMKAMEGWSKISNNIFVWDYGINFDNYLAPFPNFPILQKNIQLFKEHGTTMHFSQIASSKGGDFAEMRTYMVSKLMWNPYLDADSLMKSFMSGYYGAAAPYLYEYEKLLEGALLASGIDLWIYDSPVSHKTGMLNANCRKRYNELFDRAEAAVANDAELLRRVRTQRLSLQYSELEIARTDGRGGDADIRALLDLFEQRVAEYDIPTLNERNNSPLDYCKLYRQRYMTKSGRNKAKGAKVTWIVPPTGRYASMDTAIADELFGGTSYVESWVGWEGVDGAFVLDLGEEKEFSAIETDYLHQLGAWVLLPEKVSYSVSADGESYTLFGEVEHAEDRSPTVKFLQLRSTSPAPVRARYVKVEVTGVKTCPTWHYGVGHPAWFFLDEVTVE